MNPNGLCITISMSLFLGFSSYCLMVAASMINGSFSLTTQLFVELAPLIPNLSSVTTTALSLTEYGTFPGEC